MRPGGPRPEVPPIGKIEVKDGRRRRAHRVRGPEVGGHARAGARDQPALKHDGAGVLGVSGPNTFYLTLRKHAGLDKSATAIGKTIAGLDLLKTLKKGDPIRSIRISRVGQAARDFKTDDEAFKKLLDQ